jgi:hypothetical protein
MNGKLLAVVAGMGVAAALAPSAQAQIYGGVGYSTFTADVEGEDATLGAIMGRLGYKTNPFFGVEGEFLRRLRCGLAAHPAGG